MDVIERGNQERYESLKKEILMKINKNREEVN